MVVTKVEITFHSIALVYNKIILFTALEIESLIMRKTKIINKPCKNIHLKDLESIF